MGLFGNKDEPRQAPRLTVSGRPQSQPEGAGSVERRFRLFIECLRLLADHPLSSQAMRGVPIGDGLGMEDLVARITPLLAREQAVVRWVALRGALATLYIHTVDEESRVLPFFPMVEVAMGVGHVGDVTRGDQTLGIGPQYADRLTAEQTQAAVGLFAALTNRLYGYAEYSSMGVDDVLASPFNMSVPAALDFIAWSAVALHRLELAADLMAKVPEADRLDQPGWYTDPLWGRVERYWDGADWTTRCRVPDGRRYTYAEGHI